MNNDMTTPIKFRGFRVDGGGWVEGDLLHGQGAKKGKMYILLQQIIIPKDADPIDGYEVHPESLGQFTGQTDKNGREIFGAIGEKGGDRITMGDFDLFVKFENCSFRVFSNTHKDSDGSPLRWGELSRIWDLCWHDRAEIIGNQFEQNNGK